MSAKENRRIVRPVRSNVTPTPSLLRRELTLVCSMALGLFHLVALLSYNQVDPAWSRIGAAVGTVHNLGGVIGAYLADFSFKLFGYAAFLLPLALGYSALRLTLTWQPRLWLRLASGTLLILLAWTLGLSTVLEPHIADVGFPPGGWTGSLLSQTLLAWIGKVGLWLVVTTMLLGSLALLVGLVLADYWRLTRHSTQLSLQVMRWLKIGAAWSVEQFRALRLGERCRALLKRLFIRQGRPVRSAEPLINMPERVMATPVVVPKAPAPKPTEPAKRPIATSAVPMPALPEEVAAGSEHTFEKIVFRTPSFELLPPVVRDNAELSRAHLIENAKILEKKLADFGVEGKVTEIQPGPVITLYEYSPASGIKVNKISQLSDDLALALSALSVRIVAPIPGKAVVGIEISNPKRETVHFSEICNASDYRDATSPLTLALGKDIAGNPVIADLQKMPHLLIAGSTGSGKSVAVNTMILSILYRALPDQVRFLMIDPKMLELSLYDEIPHLLHPVIVNPRKAAFALKWVVAEMERRYTLMANLGVRNLENYNKRIEAGERSETHKAKMPYIVVVIDELADLMLVNGREIEESLTRLAQMARASGIHLLLATQRPSVDVITGIIKANFPSRISFKVASKTDSRTILDMNGAEKLLGNGDMLFMPPGTSNVQRIHGGFISENEIKQVTDFLRQQGQPEFVEIREPETDSNGAPGDDFDDAMYGQALEIVQQTKQASISMIQRRLRIGYNRAARMVERMEAEGIVTRGEAGKPRNVVPRL